MGKIKIMGRKIILIGEKFNKLFHMPCNSEPCPARRNSKGMGKNKKLGFLGVLFYVTWRSILAGFVPSHARSSGLFKATIVFMAAPAFHRAKPHLLTPSESSPVSLQSSLHETVSNLDNILVLHETAINLPPICVLHVSG